MNDILKVSEIVKIQNFLWNFPKVTAGYLYGSQVKGKDNPQSDLDMGIICSNRMGISPTKMGVELQQFIPQLHLDLTVLDSDSDPLLLIQVINGRLIYQKSLKERLLMETKLLHLYEDNLILRKINNYYLEKSFKEGLYSS